MYLFILAFSLALPGDMYHILPIFQLIPFYFTPSSWALSSLSWAEMPGCLPHFLLSSEMREERGEVWGGGGAAWDCTGFVGAGNLSFSFPCRPALPLFVYSTMPSLFTLLLSLLFEPLLIPCRDRFKTQCLAIFLFYLNYRILCVIFTQWRIVN